LAVGIEAEVVEVAEVEVVGVEVDTVVAVEIVVESPLTSATEELALPPLPPPHAVKRKSTEVRAKTFFKFDTRDILFTLV